MIWTSLIPRLLSMLLSWMDASNLRNRVYLQADRIASLELALEDIERINANSANPNALIAGICMSRHSK